MKRLQYRIATAAEFTSKNPILAKDEIGIERDTGKEKIGDGTSQWSALSYFADSATDSTKVLKTGDTMTGDLNMSGTQKVINLANGSASGDAINKGQLDAVAATAGAALPKPGSSTDNAIVRWDGTSGSAVQNSAVTISDDTTLVGPKEIVIRAEGDPADGGGGSIRTAGSRYTLVLKPRNADATYATASEFYYDSTYVGWWSESKMGCGGDFTVNASAFVNGTASADPVLRVDAVDGRTPYLTLRSQGANDVYMGWIRGNTTRFYFRCTQDTWSIRSADDSGNIWGSAPYGNVFHIDRTNSRVTLGGHTTGKYEAGLAFGTSGPREMVGTGSPEGAVTAPAGSVWRQTDDSALTYLRWYKATGTGNTGWLPDFEGRWIDYTPTWGKQGGSSPSLGNGTLTGRYTRSGKECHFNLTLTIGSSTAFNSSTGWTFTYPVGEAARYWTAPVWMLDSGTLHYTGIARRQGSGVMEIVVNGNGNSVGYIIPMGWAQNDVLSVTGTYEIA